MKVLLCFILPLFIFKTSFGIHLNSFLNEVVSEGSVNYSLIKNNKSEDLRLLIDSLNNNMSDSPSKSTLINLYNLLVIQQIVNHYPILSPMDVSGFFDIIKVPVGNQQITLNQLENDLIRKRFNDPRVHFALVCGAKGCPPIQSYAYNEETIENQLEEVTSSALNKTSFIQYDKDGSAKISEIFKWYSADFGSNQSSIINFINQYRIHNKIVSISYYSYDWSLNDQIKQSNSSSNVTTYTPSVLLRKGQKEIQLFNNLYTQDAWFDEKGDKTSLSTRGSWNTMIMTFNYGISNSSRFNVGADFNLRSTRHSSPDEYAWQIFKLEQNSSNRTTLTSLGPKIKWSPFKKIPKLSIQSAFWIPVAKNLEGTPWLDWQRYTSWTQLFFDRPIGDSYQLFSEIDLLFRIPEIGSGLEIKETQFSTPTSLFFSYFPNYKSTLYAQFQFVPILTAFPSYFAQTGFGGKYQLFPQLQIEASYTNFFAGNSQGAGATFNLGLRFISL